MAGTPLVSCIMPTRNRRRFVVQAVAYFERQDYPSCELVVVDDGDDRVDDLVPTGDRIRYVRLSGHWPLGRKRNLACELSGGELICHWDDDDWYSPDRISVQVAELLASGRDVCGLAEPLHYRPRTGEAWLYRSRPGDRPSLAGGTLLYRRSAWQATPFPDVHVGEDAAFVWQRKSGSVHPMLTRELYVGLLHAGNTAAKNLRDDRWSRRPLRDVGRLLTADRDFYAALRTPAAAPPARPRAASVISVVAPFMTYDGYGSMAEYLVLGMHRAGARVNPVALNLDRAGLSSELLALIDGARPARDGPVLYFSWPSARMRPYEAAPDLVVNTMWESSRLPATWPAALNRARAVIVPTRFVAEVCRSSGVHVPIEVIAEGIDPAVYRYHDRPERETFTTLVVGAIGERKHVREGMAAWQRAFGDDPRARLIIKARFSLGDPGTPDPRIRFVSGDERTRGIAHWYREADVLMTLGNEGFGLPLVEGMATGLPVIALDSEGQADVCEDARDLLLAIAPAGWQRCDDPPYGAAGVRAVPGVADVADRLRWVAEHRDEARAMGLAASDWARTQRDIWEKGPAVLAAIERHLRAPRVLRHVRTLWTRAPVAPGAAGESTQQLARAAGLATTSADVRDLRGVRLLHVQHEPGAFGDDELTRMIRHARAEGVPMVITEHVVDAAADATEWEREASALVTHSETAARVLRARSPGQRVEPIPLGCHTWFPQHQRRRGRVVGAFGRLDRPDERDRLAEIASAAAGVEIVLFGNAGGSGVDGGWDLTGLPRRIRREAEPDATETSARRIAQELDVLVYWCDETPILRASTAVRVGLASGVPVLTSPTSSFRDIRHATHQTADLGAGVERLLDDEELRRDLAGAAREYCHEHRWRNIARRHEEVWQSLEAT